MAEPQKVHTVWLATGFEVPADSYEEALQRAIALLSALLSEGMQQGKGSEVPRVGEVLPMDVAAGMALQILALENKGGETALRVALLRQEIIRLARQS